MTQEKAIEIAKEFLTTMNPDCWDGDGDKPSTFVELLWECDLSENYRLDISFQFDETDGWLHCCEIVDKESDTMLEMLSGYGIDSVQNLTDTILDLCKSY